MSDTREELLARVQAVLVAHDFNEAPVRVFSPLLCDLAAFLSTPPPEDVAKLIAALNDEAKFYWNDRGVPRSLTVAGQAADMLSRLSLAARDADAVDKADAWDKLARKNERIAHLEAEIKRKDEALQEIAAQVIGDCPAALFDPEFPEGWAIRRFSELRAMASAALARAPKETPA